MNNFSCIYLLMFLFCIACKPNNDAGSREMFQENENLYVIDLDELEAAGPNKEYIKYLSTIFNKSETIILETDRNCLIGSDFKFFPFDNYILILNTYPSKDFLVFDRSGKFIRKIGGVGGGPGEYSWVFDFAVDTDNQIIYLVCDMVINKYKIDGTYIGSFRLDSHISNIKFAHGKLYAELRDNKYMLQEIDPETGKQTGKYLETMRHNKGWNEPFFTYGQRPLRDCYIGVPKFAHTFMDTIFSVNQDGLMPFLTVKSKHPTTVAHVKATEGMEPLERIESIKNKGRFFCISHYWETKNHIFFCYTYKKKMSWILYDRTTNQYNKVGILFNDFVYGTHFNNYVFDDSLNNYENLKMMPVTDIAFSDSNGVYDILREPYRYFFFEDWKEQDKFSPGADKRDELMNLEEDSNPVIFYHSY